MAPLGNHLWRCARKCYGLNAVLVLAFKPSRLKLITCNKQWLNSVLLSSLLKLWDLVLNYKCPNKSVFYCFYDFICDFHELRSVKSSKMFSSHRFQRNTNFKHEKSRVCKGIFPRYFQIYVFHRCKKSGPIDFPEKRAPTKMKYLLPICQILRNFTEWNARKYIVSFAFCAHVDAIKYRKTLTFSFEPAQITSSALARSQNYRKPP